MKQWICDVCGYVYDEDLGLDDADLPQGTAWQDMPENWCCPDCGSDTSVFRGLYEDEEPPTA